MFTAFTAAWIRHSFSIAPGIMTNGARNCQAVRTLFGLEGSETTKGLIYLYGLLLIFNCDQSRASIASPHSALLGKATRSVHNHITLTICQVCIKISNYTPCVWDWNLAIESTTIARAFQGLHSTSTFKSPPIASPIRIVKSGVSHATISSIFPRQSP